MNDIAQEHKDSGSPHTLESITFALRGAGHSPACIAKARGITPGTVSAMCTRMRPDAVVAPTDAAVSWLGAHGGCSCGSRAASGNTPRGPRPPAIPLAPPDPRALVGQVIDGLMAVSASLALKSAARDAAVKAYQEGIAYASERHTQAAQWVTFAASTGRKDDLEGAMSKVAALFPPAVPVVQTTKAAPAVKADPKAAPAVK